MCGTSSKYGPSFIAQFSTNQLALSPGSPARPPNSGDEVKLSWMGVVLPDRLLPVFNRCVEAVVDTTSLHVKHIAIIGAGRSHGLAGKTSLMARLY